MIVAENAAEGIGREIIFNYGETSATVKVAGKATEGIGREKVCQLR